MDESSHRTAQEEGKRMWDQLTVQLEELRVFLRSAALGCLRFILRNAVWLLVLPVIGGVSGFIYERQKTAVYTVSMTVSYNHLEKKIYADMIEKLDQAIRLGALQEMPGFEELEAGMFENILGVKALNVKGEDLTTDLSTERVPFNVKLWVNDLSNLSLLEDAVVSYLDSPQFIQDRIAFNAKEAQSRVRRANGLIDVLQKRLIGDEASGEAVVMALGEALTSLRAAEAQLTFNSNIEVLHGLMKGSAQMQRRMKRSVGLGIGAGLMLGCLVVLLKRPEEG